MRRDILFGLLRTMLFVCLAAHGCMSGIKVQRERGTAAGAAAHGDSAAAVSALVGKSAVALTGGERDYDALMKMIGDARFVLLGEATHGTHEFYRERARITRRLIEEKGFDAVVLEADWPDAYRVGEYARGRGTDANARQALSGFTRFPQWMWRNRDFHDFVNWLRSHNESRPASAARVGIYGMDLYSISESSKAVVEYLKRVDPTAAARAGRHARCLNYYGDHGERYGREVASDMKSSCEKDALALFQEMERRFADWRARPRRERDDALFSAYQNARTVKNGESYYRLGYAGGFSTWNWRDSHMAETLQEISRYEETVGRKPAKVVVWAHNTHQGDARMTEMGEAGELNVGHLMRKLHEDASVLVGFTTYTGEVRAASEWGAHGRKMKVRPALPNSYSSLFHGAGVPNFLLILRGGGDVADALARPHLERAIGVVYLPHSERRSHYFEARLSKQFDAVIHFDVTRAVETLD
jgi:erythromycin esterase-like protein